jgi:hypothetical protein
MHTYIYTAATMKVHSHKCLQRCSIAEVGLQLNVHALAQLRAWIKTQYEVQHLQTISWAPGT